jgi:tetratricopeptide (TPR) repeat protein
LNAFECNNQGVECAAAGQQVAAVAAYDAAIAMAPDHIEAWSNRGNSLLILGRLDEALASYDQALALNDGHGAAWLGRAHLMMLRADWQAAVAAYDQGFAALGVLPVPMIHRGTALLNLGSCAAALDAFEQASAILPDAAHAQNGRAAALARLHRHEEALPVCDLAHALAPNEPAVLGTLGAVLCSLGRAGEALGYLDKALALSPEDARFHYNRAVALQDLRRLDEAHEGYAMAQALDPGSADAHWNEALLRLSQGDFEVGWAKYEWGWPAGWRGPDRGFGPPWLGQHSLQGQRLLLHAEQGLGDTLQFVRYASLAAEAGAAVMLEVQPALVGLLRRLDHVVEVVARGDTLPDFDLHCPMLSLPLAFQTLWHSIPATIPYLNADARRVALWRERLACLPRPWVGLVWAGDPRRDQPIANRIDRRRSLHASRLAPLAGGPASFISLQKGEPGQQKMPPGLDVLDLTGELQDFADTADLVAALDLVISVDTSPAHLAAALGVPVWLLNRHDSCWRWRLEGCTSPWYPSMQLFRQPSPGDWTSVLGEITAELGRLAVAAV